jgi:signal transduction histidine kinase
MGLAISRALILAHGGRMWVENAAPHGCRFCFTLPLAE